MAAIIDSPRNSPRNWQEHDPRHLLDREAPRYTSYPSAHHFKPLSSDIHADWLRGLSSGGSIGLYIHVPYCEQMCWFCGCNTQITRRYDAIAAYVDQLVAEIAHVSRQIAMRPYVHSLHFGGGSPGLLQAKDMELLFDVLRDRFVFLADAEISIELDPRRVTPDMARLYAGLGFNRVSLGLQDTDPQVQKAINRIQPMPVVRASVDALREAGIKGLGLDLIYGLPFQDEAAFGATLADALSLHPDRLSGFSHAHVPWVRKHQRLIDATALPDAAHKLILFERMTETLTTAGYTPIGIDHFACAEDGLAVALKHRRLRRNFMGYTDQPNDRLLAFGASAISEFDEGLAQNASQSATYQRLIREGGLATARGWAYREDDRVRKAVIAELMCYFEADIGDILVRHGMAFNALDAELERLKPLEALGVVECQCRVVRLKSPLKMLIRNVCAVFDRYMEQPDGQARYSRVA
ncbi:oxygen-independent coproporphyrinogen III oxidase [Asticcacaulis taihuensis]|uniref:oxygen-independent coproporphyrinogen III oxidase n=1 Tax=Asticcacaulis taihuensis TaxID=260084 RepID=UPI0026F0EBCD|nr:oxygen-independent coproporphyrinogen III oxidase [Asticcacaulis taihuensis]